MLTYKVRSDNTLYVNRGFSIGLGLNNLGLCPRHRRRLDLAGGVLAMTVGFFTWLALLRRFDLSYLYPFEGLDRVLLAFAAWLILKEKMTRDLWVVVILICIGTAFVAAS